MSLIGSLEQFDLANILRRIEIYSKTGLLVVKQGDLWVEFYFRQGQLVCIGPVRTNVTLIDRLLQANLLSPQSLPRVRVLVNPNETNETRIALALINEGMLSREILRAWSSHETSQILQAIFSWPTGEIYFDDDRPTPADRLLIGLSVTALLEALPMPTPAPRTAAALAPSTDELTHTPEYLARPAPQRPSAPLIEVGPGGQMRNTSALPAPAPGPGSLNVAQPIEHSPALHQPNTPQPNGMLNASSLIDQPPTFAQTQAPMNGGGMLNASSLIEQPPAFAQHQSPMNGSGMLSASQLIDQPPAFAQPQAPMNGGGMFNASQLVEDVPPPSFASANPTGLLGAEIDVQASTQVSILPPQPVRNPLPPARIDTSFMTPELILAPVDLSTLRERNPQVQLTPEQWSLFALIDGQVSLQVLCQALNAPAEQICMVAGELIAIGLVMPLNSATGVLNELMSASAQYPAYNSSAMMPTPNMYATPADGPGRGRTGQYPSPFGTSNGWQGQAGPAYAPVGGYR